jgi:hypothetical protein
MDITEIVATRKISEINTGPTPETAKKIPIEKPMEYATE